MLQNPCSGDTNSGEGSNGGTKPARPGNSGDDSDKDKLEADDNAFQYVEVSRPIGFIQIIDPAREDSHYWGDVAANLRAIDIWIGEESDLGKG